MNQAPFLLAPMPRQVELIAGSYEFTGERLIVLDCPKAQALRFSAMRIQQILQRDLNLEWQLIAGAKIPPGSAGLTLRLIPEKSEHPQGYTLTVDMDCILVEAGDEAGIFYGVCTLIQLIQRFGGIVPCLRIQDWPDFPVRGVMLDISRDKVPTMKTTLDLVDMLAGWKINQFQLYTEHTFAYRGHPTVWAQATPFTGQEILELDAYCRERYIELVPNQNSFGHMRRWLVHNQYAPLAEISGKFEAPWGEETGLFSLCPTDPDSINLIRSLYDELLPHFTSRMVNVGCDETFDLGQGRSKDECERRGQVQVYYEYLMKIYQDLQRRGYTMQFWADIIQLYPEVIHQLPRDLIALEWGYEANHPFDQHCSRLESAGIPFYVCPGTSSWNSLVGRTDNALDNLKNAAENGLKHGAAGFLNTDWGDGGHWQPLSMSYFGLLAGAAYSWAWEANRGLDVAAAVSFYGFGDPTDSTGCVIYELGNLYKEMGFELINITPVFLTLQWPIDALQQHFRIADVPYGHLLERVDQIVQPLTFSGIESPEKELILEELNLVVRMFIHACQRGILANEIDQEKISAISARLDQDMQRLECDFKNVWLKRNRPGGLADSMAIFERAREEYRRTRVYPY